MKTRQQQNVSYLHFVVVLFSLHFTHIWYIIHTDLHCLVGIVFSLWVKAPILWFCSSWDLDCSLSNWPWALMVSLSCWLILVCFVSLWSCLFRWDLRCANSSLIIPSSLCRASLGICCQWYQDTRYYVECLNDLFSLCILNNICKLASIVRIYN